MIWFFYQGRFKNFHLNRQGNRPPWWIFGHEGGQQRRWSYSSNSNLWLVELLIIIFIQQQTSASECVLVTMLAARAQAIKALKQKHPFVEEGHLLSKLMAYCSKEAHSCVEKAAMISFVKLRILEPDSKCSLRGETLTKVITKIQSIFSQLSIYFLTHAWV